MLKRLQLSNGYTEKHLGTVERGRTVKIRCVTTQHFADQSPHPACYFYRIGRNTGPNGVIEPYLLPAPSSLFQSFTELAEGDLWQHIWTSS